MSAKRKAKFTDVLTGRSREMQLYRAVRRYVQELGGNILVIGGIEIQQWPDDGAYKFRIAVRCAGKKPSVREFREKKAKVGK